MQAPNFDLFAFSCAALSHCNNAPGRARSNYLCVKRFAGRKGLQPQPDSSRPDCARRKCPFMCPAEIPAPNPERLPVRAPALTRRMACWLYEGMLLFGVVFIAGYLFGALTQTRNALDNRHGLQAFVFLIFGIYFVWLWSKGQTLAMKTWHIRVTDLHGQNLRQGQALRRYVLSWIWFLPPLALSWALALPAALSVLALLGWVLAWALLSRLHPAGQFWHDAWAGTQLLDTRQDAS